MRHFIFVAIFALTLWGCSETQLTPQSTPRSPLTLIPLEQPTQTTCPTFDILWNVHAATPLHLDRVEVTQNRTSIIYEAAVPHLPSTDNGVIRAGGIPQGIDMAAYRRDLEITLDWQVPDLNYNGYIIYDYESFPMTWNDLDPRWFSTYRNLSIERIRAANPNLSASDLEIEAARQYNQGVREILLGSIRYAKVLRPQAKIGFYGTPNTARYPLYNSTDSARLKAANDALSWLWSAVDAFFPVIYDDRPTGYRYASGWVVSQEEKLNFIRSMIEEAQRLSRNHGNQPVLPFVWMRYFDDNALLLEGDLQVMFSTPLALGTAGVVVWGNESTENLVQETQSYIDDIFKRTVDPLTSCP